MRLFLVASAVASALAGLPQLASGQVLCRRDSVPRAQHFASDTVHQALTLARRVLELRAEQGPSTHPIAGAAVARTTGRYAVYSTWPGSRRLLAVRTKLAYDAPSITFVSDGQPAVVVLSSYVGGLGLTGVPAYDIKVLIFDGSRVESYSVGSDPDTDSNPLSSAEVESFARVGRGFKLRRTGGPQVRYDGTRLALDSATVPPN